MRTLLTLCAALIAFISFSQPTKFGKVTVADLEKKVYEIDSSAHAVVITDLGKSSIIGNTKGFFSLQFKRYERVHILNKNGYFEADYEIPLYSNGNDYTEKLDNVKAVTYNLENGKVTETKLEKSNIFTEKVSRNLVIKKFTLPNVKEGSIIEVEYTVISDYLRNLQPWAFQGTSPRLWSEYNLALPQFLNYITLGKGYHPFDIKDQKESQDNFTVIESGGASASERYNFTAKVTDYRWAMKNVPSLKVESFTSSLNNHIAKLTFQLSAFQEPLRYQKIMASWPEVTKQLLEDEDFGKKLDDRNAWLNEVMNPLLAGATTDVEKSKRVFAFVRDNITCTNHNTKYASQPLKNVLKTKNGNVADVNLLLTAMLLDAGIKAEPVMLSTRDHGYTYSLYPVMDKFNYVIVKAEVSGRPVYLDASHTQLGFGRLLPSCYNGHARVINKEATPLSFEADSLKESKVTAIFIGSDEKGRTVGSMNQKLGQYESYSTRKKIKELGKENFLKEVKKNMGGEIEFEDAKIDSLTQHEQPLALEYKFVMNLDKQDIIYFNPMFGEGYKENYFKSAERFYPVEMPYTFDETFLATIEIPNGYVVDEMPKSMRVKLNEEGEGQFEYIISQSGNTISMRTRVQIARTYFAPEEYDLLREFFNMVVNKHKEQIVFKKK